MEMNYLINGKSINLLKEMIGKNFLSLIHEPFTFRAYSYGLVILNIDNELYELTSKETSMDYFESKEDICLQDINHINNIDNSKFAGNKSISETLNMKILNITIANLSSKIISKDKNQKTYSIKETRAIIFTFDDNYQIFFEFDPLMEIIDINRGYNLKDKLYNSIEEFNDNFETNFNILDSKIEFINLN